MDKSSKVTTRMQISVAKMLQINNKKKGLFTLDDFCPQAYMNSTSG